MFQIRGDMICHSESSIKKAQGPSRDLEELTLEGCQTMKKGIAFQAEGSAFGETWWAACWICKCTSDQEVLMGRGGQIVNFAFVLKAIIIECIVLRLFKVSMKLIMITPCGFQYISPLYNKSANTNPGKGEEGFKKDGKGIGAVMN